VPEKIFFNSSMPRSGSTLLQNILAQNPRFYCSATSGLNEMLWASRSVYSKGPEFKAQDVDQMKSAFLSYCRGAMKGYYEGLTDKPIAIDKSRGWIQYYDWIKQFWPNPRFLVTVRDLRAVLSSMEKLFHKNQHMEEWSEKPGSIAHLLTLDSRVRHWLNTAPVGVQVLRLNGLIQTGIIRHMHIVRFEDLTARPRETMKKVYAYLEEPEFEHDFEHVEQLTVEDDAYHPTYGDHKVREAVKPVPNDFEQTLGKEICELVKEENSLYFRTFYPNVR
jgi:sulfotransferase